MQSMQLSAQSVGYTYDIDLGIRPSRVKHELLLVSMRLKLVIPYLTFIPPILDLEYSKYE